jgi:exonuclease III
MSHNDSNTPQGWSHTRFREPSPTFLSILSLNCARSTTVMHTILEIAKNRKADVVILQEPWIHHTNTTITHPSFTAIVPPPNNSGRNRVCSFITKTRPDLKISHRTEISPYRDLQVLEITTGSTSTITLYNIYNGRTGSNPDRRVLDEPWSLNITSPRTIISGDFNAHHPLWNSSKRPLRADRVMHLLDEQNFHLLNTPDIPTFFNGRSESVIDLTLVSNDIMDKVRNWSVLEETTSSDHMVVCIDIHEDHPTLPPDNTNRFNSKKTNWEKFEDHLTKEKDNMLRKLSSIQHHDDRAAEFTANELQSLILTAITSSTPLSKPSPQSKRWWNKTIDDNRKILHHRRRQWKKDKTEDNWQLFRIQQNLYNRVI